MAFLRHRQRIVTALSPHADNRNWIIPKRGDVAAPTTWSTALTLTVGDDGAGLDGYYLANFGALTPTDLTNPATDTIERMYDFPTNVILQINMSGTSVPDTDVTFSQIVIEGTFAGTSDDQVYTRSDRVTYNPSAGGTTYWRFAHSTIAAFVSGNVYTVTFSGDLT